MDNDVEYTVCLEEIVDIANVIEMLQEHDRDRSSVTWQASTKLEDIFGDIIMALDI